MTDNATSASAQETPKLYGWVDNTTLSPRLFAEKWLANRAIKNRSDRYGSNPKMVAVDASPQQIAHAASWGWAPRTEQAAT